MDLSSQFALDVQGVSKLKFSARQNQQEGLTQAAQQFEAMLLNIMVKGMRDTVPDSGLLSSHQGDLYQSMMDQQWAQTMSNEGIGIADMLVKQLGGNPGPVASSEPDAKRSMMAGVPTGAPVALKDEWLRRGSVDESTKAAGDNADWYKAQLLVTEQAEKRLEQTSQTSAIAASDLPPHVQRFLDKVGSAAERASQVVGISSRLIVAQAALETGWGKHEIKTADGGQSHNLFNIKATPGWKGDASNVMTTEYIDGQAQKLRDGFRVYGSYEESFNDYARLLTQNSRYDGVVEAKSDEAAAWQLQNSGYATDPQYATKLISIMRQLPERFDAGDQLAQGPSAESVKSAYGIDDVPSRIF
ncbi:flagellar assembly peptidoglycan hydrolase FlgJ [Larsenimonas suaedae]|uniref:Peptidoglycan hydrolase FlgJ n=1 Tax=Larsenimonas suaedae TaxID=1851019 RepID=A0ABU1GT31_9GAMM|nr:flagellar assembly peptidoglycan hydrolase FlgJ [Larsenimonas suaedae]MCM2971619.1 flagellar assembly peptidoglycan hydrolase FlgJ [Larsenimonas suaedae]MDR5895171.1 flagellar assembly peptidoglycan hydrolase FlgJ [Larsenimonas suaedae]